MRAKSIMMGCIVCTALTACSASVPVKGFSSDKAQWTGSFDLSTKFKMTDGSVNCNGKGKTVWSNFTIFLPFTCDDGRTGSLTELAATSGKAEAKFSDGTTGKFYWGKALQ